MDRLPSKNPFCIGTSVISPVCLAVELRERYGYAIHQLLECFRICSCASRFHPHHTDIYHRRRRRRHHHHRRRRRHHHRRHHRRHRHHRHHHRRHHRHRHHHRRHRHHRHHHHRRHHRHHRYIIGSVHFHNSSLYLDHFACTFVGDRRFCAIGPINRQRKRCLKCAV